jgi:L-fucose isomerase-like protein
MEHEQRRRERHKINRIGVLFLGRSRPGFDPEWGAEIKKRIRAVADQSDVEWVIPSDNIYDDAGLREAIEACRAQQCEALVVTQPTVSDVRLGPVVAQLWPAPLVLWATPEKPSGSMISANSLVGTHAMAATLRHLGHRFELVYGDPDDERCMGELWQAVRLARTARSLETGKVGLVGSHAPGFTDFHADPVSMRECLGVEPYYESVNEFLMRVDGADEEAARAAQEELEALGLPYRGTDADALPMQGRYSVAYSQLLESENLVALACRDWPDLPTVNGNWPYLALAYHVSTGAPIAMEGDVDGALCSAIAEGLGVGPVYLSDWLEHDSSRITIWHTGAAPFQLCEPIGTEKGPTISTQFNNRKPSVVEATIKGGQEVTLFRLWRTDGFYHMTALEGHTETPQRHLMATNGTFQTDQVDVREWFDEMVHAGMPHHLCVVPGHHRDLFRRFARLMGLGWY